tara:strand:+ start:30 stop:818 length:789 start_codon:yes stop_codon:yes gene_type:complete
MKELEIFWVRHSVSRANVENIFEKIANNTVFYYSSLDPHIIKGAETGSCYLSKNLEQDITSSPIVGCSMMRRAIQTAILMFPNQFKEGKLKVFPGIQEKGIGSGNTANDVKTNKKLLKEWCVKMRDRKECERFSKLLKNKSEIDIAVENIYSDLDSPYFEIIKDKKHVNEETFLNSLIRYLAKKRIKKIAIVSHSVYIRNEIMEKPLLTKEEESYLRKDNKLYNNQIMKKVYRYDKKKIEIGEQIVYDIGCEYKGNDVKCHA